MTQPGSFIASCCPPCATGTAADVSTTAAPATSSHVLLWAGLAALFLFWPDHKHATHHPHHAHRGHR